MSSERKLKRLYWAYRELAGDYSLSYSEWIKRQKTTRK